MGFNSSFQCFTVFKAIILKDFLKVRVCVIAFQDIVINSAVFQVETVSVSSYGEHSGLKRSFEVREALEKKKI